MFFFRKTIKSASPTNQQSIERLEADLADFKKSMTAELEALKKDFTALIKYLEDEPEPHPADVQGPAPESQPAPEQPSQAEPEDLSELRADVGHLLERTGRIHEEIQGVKTAVEEAKKELRSHMNYMVTRLKA